MSRSSRRSSASALLTASAADCHDARRVPTDAVSKALALDRRDERLIVCTNLFQVYRLIFGRTFVRPRLQRV